MRWTSRGSAGSRGNSSVGKEIPLKIFRFPHNWTPTQKFAGRSLIVFFIVLVGFVAWLGIGVFIGYCISMLMGVAFLAWNEEQDKKKEFDE